MECRKIEILELNQTIPRFSQLFTHPRAILYYGSLSRTGNALSGEEYGIYLEQQDAVYVDIAKVASSSIKSTLASVLDLDNAGENPHDLEFPRPPADAPPGEKLYPGLFAFAFVRNPWDRLVSCYRDKIAGEVPDFTGFSDSGVAHCLEHFAEFKADMSFRDFAVAVASIPDDIADEHFRSQTEFVTNSAGRLAIDFVGQYEHLDEHFAQVSQQIGLPAVTALPRLQAAPQRDFRTYYTDETHALVKARYARDIELFRYEFTA